MAESDNAVGRVYKTHGHVTIRTQNGGQHALAPGESVHTGDVITTGHNSDVKIRIPEGDIFTLPQNESLQVNHITMLVQGEVLQVLPPDPELFNEAQRDNLHSFVRIKEISDADTFAERNHGLIAHHEEFTTDNAALVASISGSDSSSRDASGSNNGDTPPVFQSENPGSNGSNGNDSGSNSSNSSNSNGSNSGSGNETNPTNPINSIPNNPIVVIPSSSITVAPIRTLTSEDLTNTAPVVVEGTVSRNIPVGNTVTLTVDGHSYTGTVQPGGTYQIDVPANVLAGAGHDSVHVSVHIGGAGSAIISADRGYSVDLGNSDGNGNGNGNGGSTVTVEIDPLPIINAADAAGNTLVAVTGKVNVAAGTTVTVTVDGHAYTGTVGANGTYSIGVPGNVLAGAASDTVQVSVSGTDSNGHSFSGNATASYTVDVTAPAVSITLDPIAPVTSAEAASSTPIAITGTVSGEVPAGTVVTVTVNGQSFTGLVQAGGIYSVDVPGNVLGKESSGTLHATVSVTDAAGNVGTATAGEVYSVVTNAEFGIEIDPIPVINGAEAASSAPIFITGTVSGNHPAGDVVTLTVDGHSYSGVVQANGTYSIGVPGDILAGAAIHNVHVVTVSISDSNGDAANASANQSYDVELSAPPISVTVNPLAPLTTAQAASSDAVTITGTVSPNVALGTVVTATVNGHTYTGTVQAGDSFSIGIPGNVLGQTGTGDIHLSVAAVDAAGNTATADADLYYSVNPTPPAVSITVDPIAPITGSEAGSSTPIDITGSVSSNVPVGSVVTVTVDGHTYTGTVQSGGTYDVGVPANILVLGQSGGLQVSVSVTGADGAVGTGTTDLNYSVSTGGAVVVTVNPLPPINGSTGTSSNPVAITGESSNVPPGATVTVTVDGHTYTGTVQNDGSYSVGVPGNVLASSGGGTIQVSVPGGGSASEPYTVELTAPPVTVSISPMNPITATEAGSAAPVLISGTVSANVPAGTVVTATVDGNTYQGTVGANGSYTVGVPGNVLAASPTDSVHVSISTTDAAGNTATASADLPYTIATTAVSIDLTVAPIPTINGAQAASSALIHFTGTVTSNVPVVGDTVTLTVGGHSYTGTVQADGSYSIGVPGNVLGAGGTGTATLTVGTTVPDGSGNAASASITESYSVELTAPPIGISVDAIATINGIEAASSALIAITGTVSSNVAAGTVVTLTVGGQTFTGTVAAGGTFSVGVPGNVLGAATTDSVHVSVSTVDAAGNSASASDDQAYSVELNAPAIGIDIDPIATINGAQAASSALINVTGSVSSNVPAGTVVTLSVGGQTYTGTVAANGTYSIGIPGNVLAAAGVDSVHASLSTTSAAGNVASASADEAYTVELTAPPIGIGIDPISTITLTQSLSSAPVQITGTVSSNVAAGTAVTLTVNGTTYTGTTTANHTYSIGVPGNALAGASADTVHASISATDAAGNTATASADESYAVYSAPLVVGIALDPIATINAAVAGGANPVTITGTVSSNVPAGATVTLTVDGHTFTGTVAANGTFAIGVSGSVLAGASSDSVQASISVTDGQGHTGSATVSEAYTVELTAPPISIALNPIAVINGAMAASSATIAVSGEVSANVPAGEIVTVTVGGQDFTGVVQAGGTFTIGVPGNLLAGAASDSIVASVSVTDAAGNTANASATLAYTVELNAAPVSISLNSIATVNAAEAGSSALIAVTGSVSANVPVGDTVTLSVGGQTYTGMVQAGGTFSIGVPGNVLGAAASVHASVSATDAAGNTASAGITEAYTVELAAPPIAIDVDPIATVNGAMAAGGSVAFTGSVSSGVAAGATVTATVDGHTYSGTVQASGTYSISVPGSVLANAASDTVLVSVSATDAAGNTASASQSLAYSVELNAPPISISINAIATINGASAASSNPIAITGSVSGNVPVGDLVTVSAGGHTYTGTVQAGGTFSVGVPGNVLAAASSDSITVNVAATDSAGNTANSSATLTYAVELSAPPIGIGINTIATVNAAEAASSAPVPVTGTVSANVPLGDIVTLSVGGHTYTGAVASGGTYSIGVPGNVLASASPETVQASVSMTDAAGNVANASASQSYSVNTVGPVLSIGIDPIVTINGAIAASTALIAVTGTVSANVPASDLVTLSVGGQTYTGTVTAAGTFSIGVPGNVLGGASSDSVTVSVSATDSVGNTGSASATAAYTVELTAPPINIGINPIAIVNGITGNSTNPIAVTGTVSANVQAGTTVTLAVAGQTYVGTVTAQGTYSIGIPGTVLAAATTDSIVATISSTDAAGNTASASATLAYGVELAGAPVSIAVNPLPIINGLMAASSALIAVSGTVSATVPVGDTITLSVAGHSYTGVVASGGTYSIGIPGNVLAAASSDSIGASVSVTDAAGNTSSASATLAYSVELAAPPISIAINPIVTINGAMAASALPVLITGSVSANVPIGTPITLTVAGQAYTGLVLAGGIYSIGVPGNVLAGATSDNVQVSLSTTDAAGNVASASASVGYTVELVAPLISISLNPIGVLSSLLTGNIAITGAVSSNVPVGTLLTVNVGGNTYTGTVQAGGTYSVGVPALVLLAQVVDLVQVAISFTDPAGNVASASASQGYTISLIETQHPSHLPVMMHVGHMTHPVAAAAPTHHAQSLGGLLGGDKLAFSLAPHTQAAKPASLGMDNRPHALHIADLLTDHQPAHHGAGRIPVPHETFHAAALHGLHDLHGLQGHSVPLLHEIIQGHMQLHRSAVE